MTTPSPPINSVNAALGRPVRILLVKDSPSDVAMTLATLQNSRIANTVTVVRDGDEALASLRCVGDFVSAAPPDLVLLDLNLPRMNGCEVLAQMKADPTLSSIPVVILTGSSSDADVARSYQLCASAYVTKPVDADDFFDAVPTFWFAIPTKEKIT